VRSYTAIVKKCYDIGRYVGFIPGFPGAHTQAETLDELNKNLREVVEMLLEDGEPIFEAEFVGTQNVLLG
jgi:predicted RNase H-like HicB family nuclease